MLYVRTVTAILFSEAFKFLLGFIPIMVFQIYQAQYVLSSSTPLQFFQDLHILGHREDKSSRSHIKFLVFIFVLGFTAGGHTVNDIRTRLQDNQHMKRLLGREVGDIEREMVGSKLTAKSQVRP